MAQMQVAASGVGLRPTAKDSSHSSRKPAPGHSRPHINGLQTMTSSQKRQRHDSVSKSRGFMPIESDRELQRASGAANMVPKPQFPADSNSQARPLEMNPSGAPREDVCCRGATSTAPGVTRSRPFHLAGDMDLDITTCHDARLSLSGDHASISHRTFHRRVECLQPAKEMALPEAVSYLWDPFKLGQHKVEPRPHKAQQDSCCAPLAEEEEPPKTRDPQAQQEEHNKAVPSIIFTAGSSSPVAVSLPMPRILASSLSMSLSLPLTSDDSPTLSISVSLPKNVSFSFSMPLEDATSPSDLASGQGMELCVGKSTTKLPFSSNWAIPLLQSLPIHLPHMNSLPVHVAIPLSHAITAVAS